MKLPEVVAGNEGSHGGIAPAPPSATLTGSSRQLLQFEAGGGRFGLWVSAVRETIRAVAVSPLPNAPAAVQGVINPRGRIIPVLNLRERFHLPPKEIEISDHIIIAAAGSRVVAFQVDRAVGLADVPDHRVEDARTVTAAAEYVDCIVSMPDGLILIHDPAVFLSRAEGSDLDRAMDAR